MKLTDPRVRFNKDGRPYYVGTGEKRKNYLKRLKCLDCECDFYAVHKIVYCSPKCASQDRSKNNIHYDKRIERNKFVKDNQERHLCKCGCGGYIDIKEYHYYGGIQEYIPFHGRKGEKNNKWKGGISSISTTIRQLPEYVCWRKAIFERDNFTCVKCSAVGYKLNADHIKPFSEIVQEFLKEYDQFSPIDDKETLVRLAMKYEPFWDRDNGRTLCEECHKETSSYLICNKHYRDKVTGRFMKKEAIKNG